MSKNFCHVPVPQPAKRTRRAHQTQPEKCPMNIKQKSNAENESLNNRHNSSYKDPQSFKQTAEANIDIPAFNKIIIVHLIININCRDGITSSTYIFMKNSPATSYIAATFHPTIGQCAHQSLSNAATPELGMIPPE